MAAALRLGASPQATLRGLALRLDGMGGQWPGGDSDTKDTWARTEGTGIRVHPQRGRGDIGGCGRVRIGSEQ